MATTTTTTARAARRSRTSRHQSRKRRPAPTTTTAAVSADPIRQQIVYLPESVIRRVKLAAMDRDAVLRLGLTMPSPDVSQQRGISGLVAQALINYFAGSAGIESGPALDTEVTDAE